MLRWDNAGRVFRTRRANGDQLPTGVYISLMDFKHFAQLIAIGLQARIPMHMTGFPGVGKAPPPWPSIMR